MATAPSCDRGHRHRTRPRVPDIELAACCLFAHGFRSYMELDPAGRRRLEAMAAAVADPRAGLEDQANALVTIRELLFFDADDADDADDDDAPSPASAVRPGPGPAPPAVIPVPVPSPPAVIPVPAPAPARAPADADTVYFVARVQALLAERGWSQARFAHEYGTSQANVGIILGRGSRPKYRTVTRFAAVLGVAPEDLWPAPKDVPPRPDTAGEVSP